MFYWQILFCLIAGTSLLKRRQFSRSRDDLTAQRNLNHFPLYFRLNCKCDDEFYYCLKKNDDFKSKEVGITYFDVLGTQCYKREHPIVRCKKYHPWVPLTYTGSTFAKVAVTHFNNIFPTFRNCCRRIGIKPRADEFASSTLLLLRISLPAQSRFVCHYTKLIALVLHPMGLFFDLILLSLHHVHNNNNNTSIRDRTQVCLTKQSSILSWCSNSQQSQPSQHHHPTFLEVCRLERRANNNTATQNGLCDTISAVHSRFRPNKLHEISALLHTFQCRQQQRSIQAKHSGIWHSQDVHRDIFL